MTLRFPIPPKGNVYASHLLQAEVSVELFCIGDEATMPEDESWQQRRLLTTSPKAGHNTELSTAIPPVMRSE